MQGQEILFSSESMEWGTPQDIFDDLDNEFVFDVDVCAHPNNAKCDYYYGLQKDGRFVDGLTKDWSPFNCFMNPPYGRGIDQWMKKAYDEAQQGAVVVCLIPARTDTQYWHDYVMPGAHDIRFIKGRLKFEGYVWKDFIDGEDLDEQMQPKVKRRREKATNSATFPSAIVIFNGPAGGPRKVRSYIQPKDRVKI